MDKVVEDSVVGLMMGKGEEERTHHLGGPHATITVVGMYGPEKIA